MSLQCVLFRFIISDGTGMGYITCHDAAVARLLAFSAEQWCYIEEKVLDDGGLILNVVSC